MGCDLSKRQDDDSALEEDSSSNSTKTLQTESKGGSSSAPNTSGRTVVYDKWLQEARGLVESAYVDAMGEASLWSADIDDVMAELYTFSRADKNNSGSVSYEELLAMHVKERDDEGDTNAENNAKLWLRGYLGSPPPQYTTAETVLQLVIERQVAKTGELTTTERLALKRTVANGIKSL